MVTLDNTEYLLADTVGFIRKLPHTLISAFRSTLEEDAARLMRKYGTDIVIQ